VIRSIHFPSGSRKTAKAGSMHPAFAFFAPRAAASSRVARMVRSTARASCWQVPCTHERPHAIRLDRATRLLRARITRIVSLFGLGCPVCGRLRPTSRG
jgi:hypothetical protein